MSRPVTNCSPSIRMARSMPLRIRGSPPRATSRVSADDRPSSLLVDTSRPVISRPQVAALTNSEGLLPMCERQSPSDSLSRISRSAVALSGTRSKASARHIRATPSWLERENSFIRASTPLERVRTLRKPVTRSWASWRTGACKAGSSRAASTSGGTHTGSGRRQASSMCTRSAGRGCAGRAAALRDGAGCVIRWVSGAFMRGLQGG